MSHGEPRQRPREDVQTKFFGEFRSSASKSPSLFIANIMATADASNNIGLDNTRRTRFPLSRNSSDAQ